MPVHRGYRHPCLDAIFGASYVHPEEATLKNVLGLLVVLAVAQSAQAADIEAGKKISANGCEACHGANGVSVSATTPNLASQRAGYLEAQLKAYKDGARKQPGATSPTAIMSAMATQLSAEDIANVAAYRLTARRDAGGPSPRCCRTLLRPASPSQKATKVPVPRKYHTINFPTTKQVRYFYANMAAVTAAKAGKPLPDGSVLFVEVYAAKLDTDNKPVMGAEGFYVADKLLQYTAMASGEGWGKDIPDMLRNADWNYAIFTEVQAASARCEPSRMPSSPQTPRQRQLHLHSETAR